MAAPACSTSACARIGAVVLAGGASRRMGSDKALLPFGERTLLEWAVRRLAMQAPLVMVAGRPKNEMAPAGVVSVGDAVRAGAGPLAGILGAIGWLRAHEPAVTHLVSVPVDVPFFPDHLVARLRSNAEAHTVAVAASGERLHPTCACWPLALAPRLRRCLESERIPSLHAVLAAVGARTVTFENEPFDPFFNVNTPAELREARRLLESL